MPHHWAPTRKAKVKIPAYVDVRKAIHQLEDTVTSTSEERGRNGIQWDTRGHLHRLCTIFISSGKNVHIC